MTYYDITRFGELDIYLFKEGTHTRLYEKFGAHPMERKGQKGYYFALWAPHAKAVSVVGDWNGYDPHANPLKKGEAGIWEGFIPNLVKGQTYKYHIITPYDTTLLKADPYAFYAENPPKSASRLWDLGGYAWRDRQWMRKRPSINATDRPINIYEVHLGSWRKKEDGSYLSYKEAARELVQYLTKMHYTHIELMPIMEHPFKGSWGYQITGYFAPTARYGTPQEFMEFVDTMHSAGIGVILDWVPSHFVTDGHGLVAFDGTALYEYEDPRKGYHPEWKSAIFDYGKGEVRSFLLSSAHYWLDRYHVDGIRVDAVASMLYLDYARKEGEWVPNIHGGNENLEAIAFLQELNKSCYRDFEGIMMVAEESTAFPGVTAPVDKGGLGFGYKWNMGWMHDTLKYFKTDPLFRKYHHNQITFSMWYNYDENFILPLSHDEVVHMKGSLINKMPGDVNQKFANLRALLAYMIAHPDKKLLFMGGEFGQWKEWNYKDQLEWYLLDYPLHKGLQKMVATLNRLYKEEPALHELEMERDGFEWLNEKDWEREVLVFARKGKKERIVAVCNFADTIYPDYRIPLAEDGIYEEIFNSQAKEFEGWDENPKRIVEAEEKPCCAHPYSTSIDLPALGVLFLKKR